MKYFDEADFESEEEMIEYLRETTDKFDILDFYNGLGDENALVVITPNQFIEVNPLNIHAYALARVNSLLYDNYDSPMYEEFTKNINIRLVRGTSYQFNALIPKTINSFQKEKMLELIESLKDYSNSINFPTQFDAMLFSDTYENSVSRLNEAMVDNNILTDNEKNIISSSAKSL